MIFEHFAINVKDPGAVKDWYCTNVGLHVVFEMKEPPFMTFLADKTDRVVCELYHKSEVEITDFSKQNHLTFHFAFETANAKADSEVLQKAGASFVEEVNPNEDTILIMLRDPWGLPIQLCQRGKRMNKVDLV